jgi:hypothetical protein
MAERQVTVQDIQYVLDAPDVTMDTSQGVLWQRRFPDGRELKVWLVDVELLRLRAVVKSVAWR